MLKLGSKGAHIITEDLSLHVDVVTKTNHDILKDYKIVDTVGAGDCFTGAFAVKFTELNWKDSKMTLHNYK